MHTGLLDGQVPETSSLEYDFTGTSVGQLVRHSPSEGGGQTQFPYGVGVLHRKVVCSRFSRLVRTLSGFLGEWLFVCLGGAGVCNLAALWWGLLTIFGLFPSS